MKTLIIAPSWIGDTILAQPLFALLKQNRATIHVFAPTWCAAVLSRMPEVDQIIESPFRHGELKLFARWKCAQSLKAERYDQAIVLPNSFKSALVPFFTRIARRTGYLGEQRIGLLNDWRILDEKKYPRLVDRFLALGMAKGETINASTSPRLRVDNQAQERSLHKLRLTCKAPLAILCPGAEYGSAKRWPSEHFAELALKLHHDGYAIWLLGSTRDREIGESIVKQAMFCRNLCGLTTLDEALDLLSLATVVVSNDSGLMHAAAALNVPLVALFGSSSPSYTPPLADAVSIARLDLPCSPCFQRECPLGHLKCLRELKPEPVHRLLMTQVAARKIHHHHAPQPIR